MARRDGGPRSSSDLLATMPGKLIQKMAKVVKTRCSGWTRLQMSSCNGGPASAAKCWIPEQIWPYGHLPQEEDYDSSDDARANQLHDIPAPASAVISSPAVKDETDRQTHLVMQIERNVKKVS